MNSNSKMNPKCPACGAGFWKVGFSRGNHRVYLCKSCEKRFNGCAGTPFWYLKGEEKKVLIATVL